MSQPLEVDKRTSEFKTAVAEAAEKRTAELAAQVNELKALIETQHKAATALSPATDPVGLKAIMEHLGMTLADISSQGVGTQKPIAPEVLRAREEAHKLMVARIKRAKADGERPRYRVLAVVQADFGRSGPGLVHPFWEDSDKVRQPTEIEWPGVPNTSLEPLNGVAKEIMTLFKDSIGNMGRVTAAEELKDIGSAFVHGPEGLKKKRDYPGKFDAEPDEEGAKVLHRGGRGQPRRVNILGSIAEPAEVSH